MFDKKPKLYTDQLGKTNRIVEGTIIKGDILSKADFRLDGDLIGNFQSNGKIVIGPAGSVKGDIVCKNADIEGRFDGRIQVEEVLSLKATSVINGEATCGKLSVEPGAEFNATCVMKPNQNKLLSGEKRLEEKN